MIYLFRAVFKTDSGNRSHGNNFSAGRGNHYVFYILGSVGKILPRPQDYVDLLTLEVKLACLNAVYKGPYGKPKLAVSDPDLRSLDPVSNDAKFGVPEIKTRNRSHLRPGNTLHGHEKHASCGPQYLIQIISRNVNVY